MSAIAVSLRTAGVFLLLTFSVLTGAERAQAVPAEVLDSVVSVLPDWPGFARSGQNQGGHDVPEGSGVVIAADGYVATALHVVERATGVRVRLSDGRVLPARVVGGDPATDIAVLKVDADLPVIAFGAEPALGSRVCAIGNAFGLDLSLTCGVVSALHRSGTGFNPIEDFVQTDAAVNPGTSGGALVDGEGRLVGMISAIFTLQSDGDIGVNFAVSTPLLMRVATDLMEGGRVRRVFSGLIIESLPDALRSTLVGVRVRAVRPNSPASKAGIKAGDLLLAVGKRPVRRPSDVSSAFGLKRPGDRVMLRLQREGAPLMTEVVLVP